MVFPETHHPEIHLRGKPKGIKRVLQECGLWQERRADGCRFLFECPTTGGRTGCDRNEDGGLVGGCCARALLAAEHDFRGQKVLNQGFRRRPSYFRAQEGRRLGYCVKCARRVTTVPVL